MKNKFKNELDLASLSKTVCIFGMFAVTVLLIKDYNTVNYIFSVITGMVLAWGYYGFNKIQHSK